MQPISINVQIQVGVTDQLYKLLAPLANLPAQGADTSERRQAGTS